MPIYTIDKSNTTERPLVNQSVRLAHFFVSTQLMTGRRAMQMRMKAMMSGLMYRDINSVPSFGFVPLIMATISFVKPECMI